MQLFLILAIILLCGNSGAQNILNEVVPVLESMGDKDLSCELKQAVKSAEEISSYINALGAFAKANAAHPQKSEDGVNAKSAPAAMAFPLQPISAIAPPDVQTALANYVQSA